MTAKQNLNKLPWPAWLAIGIILFLALLPTGIRIGALYTLEKFGAESASLDDVDLNLFTGHFAIEGLKVQYANQPTLSIDALSINLNMLSLPRRRILVDTFTLSGLDIKIFQQQEQWVVGLPLPHTASTEEAEPAQSSEPGQWQFGIHKVNLQDIAINASYQGSDHSLALEDLSASELLMWMPDEQSRFTVNGRIDNAPLKLNSDLQPFAETKTVSVQMGLENLDLSPLQHFLPKQVTNLAARLSLDTTAELALQKNGDIHLIQDGTIAIALDKLGMADTSATAEDIRWQGLVDVTIAANQQPVINTTGKVSLHKLQSDYRPMLLSARLADLQWQGKAVVDLAETDKSLTAGGKLQLDKLQLYDIEREADLLSLDGLALDDIRIKSLADIQMAALTLKQIRAMQNGESALGRLGAVKAGNIQLAQMNTLDIEAVDINALDVDLARTPQGDIRLLDSWLADLQKRQQAAAKNNADAKTTEAAKEPAANDTGETPGSFNYTIGTIQLTGDSRIYFTDEAVTPTTKHPVGIKKVNIGKLSSKDSAKPTPLDIALKLYDHGSLKLDGQITLLKPVAEMDGKLAADIKGVEMPDLSPYLENAIGYQANSGQVNITSKARITNGELDSETDIKVLRIDLKPVNRELIARAGKQLAMPVNTALAAITDSDNTLKLTVPVNGDLANPDVHIEKIMRGALTQAVKNSAVTYFKYAVQPFGAIVMVSQKIGDMQLQARFEDVHFRPGEAAIVEKQSGYLEKVADMIKAKKDFSVLVCVMVTDQDFQAMGRAPLPEGETYQWDKTGETLARERLQLILSTLIDKYGLSANQVQSCKPQLDSGTPRAILGI